MDAADWDRRYAEAGQWSADPNSQAAELIDPLPTGRALDVAAGEGRMALWLANRGWDVEAAGFSREGVRMRQDNAAAEARMTWRVADVLTTNLGTQEFDLSSCSTFTCHVGTWWMSSRGRPPLSAAAEPSLSSGTTGTTRCEGQRLAGPTPISSTTPLCCVTLCQIGRSHDSSRSPGPSRLEQVTWSTDSGAAIDTLLFAQRPRR